MTRWRWRCHVISTFIEQNSRIWPWTHHSEAAPQCAGVQLCAATWWSNISLFLADLQSRWQVSEGTTTVGSLCWSVLMRPSWEFMSTDRTTWRCDDVTVKFCSSSLMQTFSLSLSEWSLPVLLQRWRLFWETQMFNFTKCFQSHDWMRYSKLKTLD